MSNCLNDANEIKLDDVIKKVTKTKEFNNIINNISETLFKLNDINGNDSMDKPNINKNKNMDYNITNSDSDDDENLESVLGAFFMDKDGNNICDCLSDINKNLEKIAKNLKSKNE